MPYSGSISIRSSLAGSTIAKMWRLEFNKRLKTRSKKLKRVLALYKHLHNLKTAVIRAVTSWPSLNSQMRKNLMRVVNRSQTSINKENVMRRSPTPRLSMCLTSTWSRFSRFLFSISLSETQTTLNGLLRKNLSSQLTFRTLHSSILSHWTKTRFLRVTTFAETFPQMKTTLCTTLRFLWTPCTLTRSVEQTT